MKSGRTWTEHFLGICVGIVAFFAAHKAYRMGMPQKWNAAILGTLVPFYAVVIIRRSSWFRSTFWMSIGACFAAHCLLIWVFFEFILWDAQSFGWIWWVPVAFIETVALLSLQLGLERKLRAMRSH
jgi:hypothetical protein